MAVKLVPICNVGITICHYTEIACLVLYDAGYTSGAHNAECCENDTR